MLEQLALLAAFSDVVKALMYLVIIGSSLMLIAVVLLQEGKGGGFGDAFGGMGTETFGARAGGVNKFTATIAAFFFVAILSVHLINRPPTPVEPEFESAQMQPTNPQPSPFGSDPDSPFGADFGNPDNQGMPNMPQTPSLTPQQVAERQFQLFNSNASAGEPPSAMPFDGPAPEGTGTEGSAPNPAASNDPWSDPAWGLSAEEQTLGSLAPILTPPPAPAETPEAAPAGGNE